MIVFDGISLESVAPVRIDDIRVSPVNMNPVIRARAIDAGAQFVRMRYGERTVAITFAVQVENRTERENFLMNISKWAKSDKAYRLELPNHPDLYLEAVCTGKPEPSFRQWWEAKLRLVFTAYDNPFWTSKIEFTAACGTAFHVLGDAPPMMKIVRTLSSTASNQSYSLDNRTMTFSAIPTGDLVIDINKQTAAVGGGSIMSSYDTASKWIIPRTGSQTITGTGNVKYRERWL